MTAESTQSGTEIAGRRVLVTGASGFVGSHLARALIDLGAVVGAFSRTPGRCESLIRRGACTFYSGAVERESDCASCLNGFQPDVILHFASRPDGPESSEHAAASIEVNLKGTINLLSSFRAKSGIFLYGDSCKVYGNGEVPHRSESPLDPNSSYAMTKAAAWWMCRIIARERGFHAVSIRPTLIYGPGQGMNVIRYVAERALHRADAIPLSGGRQTRDPLFIDDAVRACVRTIERGASLSGRVITIGGGREITVESLAQTIVDVCQAPSRVVPRPEEARPTEIWRSWCDNLDARRLLDWSPSIGLREGLQRTVESMRPE